MRLMCDILVLAFQTDTTRFCTLKLNNDISSLRFTNLGIGHTIHHMLSHQESDNWLKVNQFFVRQVAYVAQRLDEIQEGERTLLDNSVLLFCSSMLTGNHDASQLPVVLLGGRVDSWRSVAYTTIVTDRTARCPACTCRWLKNSAFGWNTSVTRMKHWRRSRAAEPTRLFSSWMKRLSPTYRTTLLTSYPVDIPVPSAGRIQSTPRSEQTMEG